MVYLLNITQ